METETMDAELQSSSVYKSRTIGIMDNEENKGQRGGRTVQSYVHVCCLFHYPPHHHRLFIEIHKSLVDVITSGSKTKVEC